MRGIVDIAVYHEHLTVLLTGDIHQHANDVAAAHAWAGDRIELVIANDAVDRIDTLELGIDHRGVLGNLGQRAALIDHTESCGFGQIREQGLEERELGGDGGATDDDDRTAVRECIGDA